MYLRTADYMAKKSCGIYELKSESDRVSYKIFADQEDLRDYLKKIKVNAAKEWLLYSERKNTRSISIRRQED